MLTNRTSLMTCIAVATLGLATAGATAAQASPCPISGFFAAAGKSYSSYRPVSKPRKAYTARPRERQIVAKPASSYAQAAKPIAKPIAKAAVKPAVKSIKVAGASTRAASGVAGPVVASVGKPVASTIAGTVSSSVPSPAVSAPADGVSACLTKEYLETGAVMFKDTCSKEWAINTTHISNPTVTGASRTCLSKEQHRNGVVMFRDACTKEWAMNTAEQHAEARGGAGE
jgi:hypothetical protein